MDSGQFLRSVERPLAPETDVQDLFDHYSSDGAQSWRHLKLLKRRGYARRRRNDRNGSAQARRSIALFLAPRCRLLAFKQGLENLNPLVQLSANRLEMIDLHLLGCSDGLCFFYFTFPASMFAD